MLFIRQSATHKVVFGPAVAVGDGFTPVTNLDISTADEAYAILHDNGTAVDISGYTWAAIANADGYYHLTLQAAISGTVGHLTIQINDDSLNLPLKEVFTVVDTEPYDDLLADSAVGYLKPTTAGRDLDVSAGGEAGIDWANVGSPTTAVDLSATDIQLCDTVTTNSDMRGTDSAALATVCTEGRLAELDAANLPTDIAAIPTTMRGTDSAALASVCTESRLAELDAGNLPTDIAAIPTTMRGTDSAALASVCTETRLAELDAGNLPTDVAAIPTTAMRGTDSAATEAKQDIIDTNVDAVKAKTDDLTFTVANELDINLHSINDVTITGTGVSGDEFEP